MPSITLMDNKVCFYYNCQLKKFPLECISTYNMGVNGKIGLWYKTFPIIHPFIIWGYAVFTLPSYKDKNTWKPHLELWIRFMVLYFSISFKVVSYTYIQLQVYYGKGSAILHTAYLILTSLKSERSRNWGSWLHNYNIRIRSNARPKCPCIRQYF
jgi:hypothetical protein